jgi:hypothetical protein
MIKSLDQARRVCTKRQAAGLRGIPRAVARWMKRTTSIRDFESSRAVRVNVLNLPFNSPL